MNAAAAHAAFVMTVSAARMYWLLRHAQHARYIDIHKLHLLPEKNWLALCRFSAQWNTPSVDDCRKVGLSPQNNYYEHINFIRQQGRTHTERQIYTVKNKSYNQS